MFTTRHHDSNPTTYTQLDANNNELEISTNDIDAHEILGSIIQLRSLIRETKSLRILRRMFPRYLSRLFPMVNTLKNMESEWQRYSVMLSQLFFKMKDLENQLKAVEPAWKCSLCSRFYRLNPLYS